MKTPKRKCPKSIFRKPEVKRRCVQRMVKRRRWYVTTNDGEYTHGCTIISRTEPKLLDNLTIKIGGTMIAFTDSVEKLEAV